MTIRRLVIARTQWRSRKSANGIDESYRLIFAQEGRRGRVLLALVAISKKSQKTPGANLRLAERRLADWRARGRRD